MRILFIAPLPPPITGQSLAVEVFKSYLSKFYSIEVVNLSKNKSEKNGKISFNRVSEIVGVLKKTRILVRNSDIVYFTISESIAGNIKDILVYILCYKKLNKTIVHLHGGAGIRLILAKKATLLYKVNKFFLKKLGGVIVLGERHLDIFSGIISKDKLQIIPNFAEDYIFCSELEVSLKFQNLYVIRILFLSNLISGKGYLELFSAFQNLSEPNKANIRIDFAGGFESEIHKNEFLSKISPFSQIVYHGIVRGNEKKALLEEAHIFCLPTYYSYEGQPISILEAYACGCVVVTTNHSGIFDVFTSEINGFEVEKKSVISLQLVLERIIKNKSLLSSTGLSNLKYAENNFRESKYNASLKSILEIVNKNN